MIGVREDLHGDGDSKHQAKARLRQAGFTASRDTRTWRVYVLELDLPAASTKGWLYGGETSRDIPTRIQQHLARARNARGRLYSEKVAAHFVRRQPDLKPGRLLMSTEASRRAKRRWAERLGNRGGR